MRADDLDHAIAIQNASAFGLTGGIQSLDEHEVATWLERVEVGNAYVNRHITGAIVQRQPFGGWKRSSVGCGPKAGGPAYVEAFGTWSGGARRPTEFEQVWRRPLHRRAAIRRACSASRTCCGIGRCDRVGLLVGDGVDHADGRSSPVWPPTSPASTSSTCGPTTTCTTLIAGRGLDRVRVLGDVDDDVRRAWRAAGVDIDSSPAVAIAEVELRRWVREQSISWTRHRHGRSLSTR